MSNKNAWVLFDSVTKIQSQPLTQDQLQSAIFKMQKTDHTRFHIWTTGWQSWQVLNVFLDSDQTLFIKDIETAKKLAEEKTVHRYKKDVVSEDTLTKSVTKAATIIKMGHEEMTQTSFKIKDKETKFDGDNLTWSGAAPPQDLNFSKTKMTDYSNRAARHELKIEVLLVSPKGKTFRSYSKNISLTGTMIEDNVPFDYYGASFDVIVVSRYASNPINSRVQLKSKIVGEGLTSRLQFENVTDVQKQRLTILLNEYIEKQKGQAKKSAA